MVSKEQLEELIGQIKGVVSVKVVVDNQIIEEIHVLCDYSRNPKQITRDIQSAAVAKYGLHIDYRKISIAQLNISNKDFTETRIKIEKIGYESTPNSIESIVTLSLEERIETVTESSIAITERKHQGFIKATLGAVEKLLGLENQLSLREYRILDSSGHKIILVIVNLFKDGREEVLSGSSVVADDMNLALVKAALNAVNRRLQVN